MSTVNITSFELSAWPLDHFQGFTVIVMVLPAFDQVGVFAGLSAGSTVGVEPAGAWYIGGHICHAKLKTLWTELFAAFGIGRIQFGAAPGGSANVIGPAVPLGVPAAGIIPPEPGCVTDVEAALPPWQGGGAARRRWQPARAVPLATARPGQPMRLVPKLMIAPPSFTVRPRRPARP